MTYEDKIVRGGEITAAGDFKTENGAFYLMVVPKAEDASGIAVLTVKLSMNKEQVEYPFVAGTWNPVVCNAINVKSQDLASYRIFYGETL